MVSGLVKAADPIGAIFYGHSGDGTDLRMEGWPKIDHVVA